MENSQFDPIFIQIIISLAGIILASVLTYYFSKKAYKNERLFDRKLIYLEEIYSQIISLEKDLKKYIFTIGADMKLESLQQKKEEITLVQSNFFELQDYFWKKEIILDYSSIIVIQSFIDISNKILGNLQASIISQQLHDTKTANKQWCDGYELIKDAKNSLLEAKNELKNDFKNTIINK